MPDFRVIPSIEQLRQRPAVRALEERFGHQAIVDALRAETETLRLSLASGARSVPADAEAASAAIEQRVNARVELIIAASLGRVINATGVIIHTNLGRAPLSRAAAERVAELAAGYTNLEWDIDHGTRGARDTHAERLLCRLTGAEAAVVVNNNAAATMLILAALAAGREVLISRGELVEIGGGFRVPDVMAQSGAILREVGTTNRTRVSDYAAAINDRTGLILRVHPSNFQITGFTERASLEELVSLGERFGIAVAEDLGSGYLGVVAGMPPVAGEPEVRTSVAAGVDAACFSGDKLLGGPQAGLIVGKRDAVTRIRKHPLMRALRVDKMTYAALEATLQSYATGHVANEIPVARMIAMSRDEIAARASALAEKLRAAGYEAAVMDGSSTIGGGSAPGSQLPTVLVAIAPRGESTDRLLARLRAARPPVVARIEADRVVLDLRTVDARDDEIIMQVLTIGSDRRF
ncbi:MAG: L-seryl-tRNA(Sec) selenium transferase [Acidobacteriota bacterium]